MNKLTLAEFHEWEYDEDDLLLYELINGQPVSRTAYSPRHQTIVGRILVDFQLVNKQGSIGELLLGPIEVALNQYNAPQPDLVYLASDKAHVVTQHGVEGVPTMVVEVISPSSIYRDRVTKKALYEQFGIQEYWVVDPADNFIEIFALAEGQYKLLSAASVEEGQLTSAVLPGFVFDLKTLFSD